jgi:hypothetical protein
MSAIDCGAAGSATGTTITLANVSADVSCTITNTRLPAAKLTIGRKGIFKTGRARIVLRCSGPAGKRCKGKLRLNGGPAARFSIATGKRKTVKVRVTRTTRRRLQARHKAVVGAVARLNSGKVVKRKVTLSAR